MRIILTAATLIACIHQAAHAQKAKTVSGPTPLDAAAAFACATSELSQREYTITNGSLDVGFVAAERRFDQSGKTKAANVGIRAGTFGLFGKDVHAHWDQLNVAVYKLPSGAQGIRVSATTAKDENGRKLTPDKPGKDAQADANAIFEACTKSPAAGEK